MSNLAATETLTELISQQTIAEIVQRLAHELARDYRDRAPLVIGLVKGSFMFLADLVRSMETPIQRIELVRFSSYGNRTVSSGQPNLLMGIDARIVRDQHVIIVEDIVDTGITLSATLDYLKGFQPASLALCALLDKPDRRQQPVSIDYLGMTIADRFIVGYGIDYAEKYRQLPAIYALEA